MMIQSAVYSISFNIIRVYYIDLQKKIKFCTHFMLLLEFERIYECIDFTILCAFCMCACVHLTLVTLYV